MNLSAARTASLLARGETLRMAVSQRATGKRPHAEEVLARFDEVDDKLVTAGFPATSPWWRAQVVRWYQVGCRQFVPRCGRRAGKSSTLSRVFVVDMLYGDHVIPPGDTGVLAIISTDRSEAAGRLNTIIAILDTLGVAHAPWGNGIQGIRIVGRPLGVRVFTASIKGVSGFTAIGVFCDEVAKWADSSTGANPASEVLASVRPTMKTQRNAKIALSSSPMGMLDAHYDAFEEGDTDYQIVATAPTWVANPTVTEADTRADERDESKWKREYAAIPQAEVESSLLTEELVDRNTRDVVTIPKQEGYYYRAAMDPATRGNAWTLAIATRTPEGKRVVVRVHEWVPAGKPLSSKVVFAEMLPILAEYGLNAVETDQFAIDPLAEHARDAGIYLREGPWTQMNKAETYEEIATLLRANELELPPVKQVKTDLLGIRKKLTRSGVVYQLVEQNGRHSDYAPSIAKVVMAARAKAQPPGPKMSVADQAEKDKQEYLERRTRERRQQERYGRAPPTHRKRVA